MPKSIEDVKKALAAIPDGGSELVEALESHITQEVGKERETGIKAKKKANDEAEGLRGRLKKFEAKLGVDSAQDDFEQRLEELVSKTKSGSGKGGDDIKTHPDFLEINSKLKQTMDALTAIQEKAKKDRGVTEDNIRKTVLHAALTKLGVHKDHLDDQVELLSRRVKVKEDNTAYVEGDDGEPVAVDAYASTYVAKKPRILENPQNPGGGGGGGKGGESGRPGEQSASTVDRLNRVRSIASDTPI